MHYRKKPTYEKIRMFSVQKLLSKSYAKLNKLEKTISNEHHRSGLALAWVRGIIRLKKSLEGNNHE